MENCKGTTVNHYYCCGCKGGQNGNIEANFNYSFKEQFTGKHWVDGKKIYQKTIDIGTIPDNDLKEVSHGIENINYVINYEGNAIGNDSRGSVRIPLPYPYPVDGGQVTLSCRDNHVRVLTKKADYWTAFKGFLTIFYTCTDR